MINIILTGIGGQGIVFSSRLLATAAINSGYRVKVTERVGLAQRGGSVLSFVRIFKDSEPSPIIPKGKADLLVGFEVLEGLRNIHYLRRDGYLVLNRSKAEPINIKLGMHKYPSDDEIRNILENYSVKHYFIDAKEISMKHENPRGENVALIGFVTGLGILPLEKDSLLGAIKIISPKKYLEKNRATFETGYEEGVRVRK